MEAIMERPQIYIIASQTGTLLSRLLKHVTGAKYNHVSISVDGRMETMYSFGRRHPYNPVWGGYVKESPLSGTFARFDDAQARIMSMSVTPEQYEGIRQYLEEMYKHQKTYHYNIIGLVLAGLKVPYRKKNYYYCSEFVREVLVKFGVIPSWQFGPIVQPQQLLDMPGGQVIYDGLLTEYPLLPPHKKRCRKWRK